jgi:hypothetical protein
VSAANGHDVSNSLDLVIGYSAAITPIPVTDAFFKFTTTKVTNDTLLGFSDAVIANPDLLVNYNSLDFSGSVVKYMDGNAEFNDDVFGK